MSNSSHQSRARIAARACALCALLLSFGCAPEAKPVDRVQTNLVDKAVFEGEWWYSSTAIDVDYDEAQIFNSANAMAPFEGSMSVDMGVDFNRGGPSVIGDPVYSFPIARIRWVIDENYLFAFRSFELVQGGDKDGNSPDYRGEPLAVFKISAHVDVRNGYNSTTGETTNVREENTEDRRWYERKFIRVDWSTNLIQNFAANDAQLNELFTAFRREPAPFFIQEGSGHPKSYEPQFVRVADDPEYRFAQEWPNDQRDRVHFMSFVTKEIWSPRSNCVTAGGTCASAAVTMRNAFLRIPPQHEYAVTSLNDREFERFGIFRSHQPAYTRGGEDRSTLHEFCFDDKQCGPGGACDKDKHVCSGGLTDDKGETDFLSFFASRHNLYSDSLDQDAPCVADWECDARYAASCSGADPNCAAELERRDGAVCDRAAHLCTIPERKRTIRPITYRLSPHFPPYLIRQSFEAVAQWNEALMRGRRASIGQLAVDQYKCAEGICTTKLAELTATPCQTDNPTGYCYCGSPDDHGGECRRMYDPFESPQDAKARGVKNPYECHVVGPKDIENPQDFSDYATASTYEYRFEGSECILKLAANSCDVDPNAACEELGDLRHHFITHLQHGGVNFGGVAQPLSDPTTGELVVSNATVAAESLESIGTLASQYFPVLRGDIPEDQYFTGENLRGYYGRLGMVEHPVAIASTGNADYTPNDATRPAGSRADLFESLKTRLEKRASYLEKLRGQDGRTAILSDRRSRLDGSSLAAALNAAVTTETLGRSTTGAPLSYTPTANDQPLKDPAAGADPNKSIFTRSPLDEEIREHKRRKMLAARNMDDFQAKLYNGQYWQYWAEAFSRRPVAEAALRMQQLYYQSVVIHEVGHALGLRHNFAGSLDRNNYHDGYFQIARDLPLPYYLDYDDAEKGGNQDRDVNGEESQRFAADLRTARKQRLARGAGNVMTASVMDYDGDLSELSGIGRYDAAAAMFSYFDKVEGFEAADPTVDPDNPAGSSASSLEGLTWSDKYRRELFTYYRGGESCVAHSDCPYSAGRATTQYQPIKQTCTNNPRTPNTTGNCSDGHCICSNFFDDFKAYAAQGTGRYSPVEYLYCHDNRSDDLSWCTTFDAGETFQETVEHYRQTWLERYPQQYFRNFRRNGPARRATGPSVVSAVKLYQHLFFRYFNEPGFRENSGPRGFFDQMIASADVLNWLGEIIAAPDVGTYTLDATTGNYRVDAPAGPAASSFTLQPGQGFYLWSAYQEGQNGFFRLERAGTFLDKLYAIESIAKRDWGLSYTIDERYFINFYDLFPAEVVDLFGGVMLRNPKAYAPRVTLEADGSPKLTYLNMHRGLTQAKRANNETTYPGPAVDGSDSEVLRDAAATYALAEFPVFYDTSFEQRLLVFRTGSGDGYTIPTTREDGTPTCAEGSPGCTAPDYIVYDSDRLHSSFVAVVIKPRAGDEDSADDEQLAFKLLQRLKAEQASIRELSARDDLSAAETERLSSLRSDLERDESFVDYMIEMSKVFGISRTF